MDMLSCFADNLKELIFDNNISTRSLCEKLDLNLSQFYRYLKLQSLPHTTTIVKIADYFCCSIDYLLGLEPHLIDDKLNYTPPFSVAFAQILKENNITRYQLNKHTKISNSKLDYWYNGKQNPSIESVIKLTKYFDCTIDKLLCREYR